MRPPTSHLERHQRNRDRTLRALTHSDLHTLSDVDSQVHCWRIGSQQFLQTILHVKIANLHATKRWRMNVRKIAPLNALCLVVSRSPLFVAHTKSPPESSLLPTQIPLE